MLDRATGKHVSLGTFPTKQDANAALNRAVADQSRGKWVSPERGRVTVAAYAREWIERHPGLGPRTRERYAGLLEHHITPHLGKASIGDLTTASVRRRARTRPWAGPGPAPVLPGHGTGPQGRGYPVPAAGGIERAGFRATTLRAGTASHSGQGRAGHVFGTVVNVLVDLPPLLLLDDAHAAESYACLLVVCPTDQQPPTPPAATRAVALAGNGACVAR